MLSGEVDIVVTMEDFQYYWRKAKERTSSSFSRVHFGHYKAAAKSEYLFKIHALKLSLHSYQLSWDLSRDLTNLHSYPRIYFPGYVWRYVRRFDKSPKHISGFFFEVSGQTGRYRYPYPLILPNVAKTPDKSQDKGIL